MFFNLQKVDFVHRTLDIYNFVIRCILANSVPFCHPGHILSMKLITMQLPLFHLSGQIHLSEHLNIEVAIRCSDNRGSTVYVCMCLCVSDP